MFYVINLFRAVMSLSSWGRFLDVGLKQDELIWCVSWIAWSDPVFAPIAILVLNMVSALFGASFPFSRTARAFAAFSGLQALALANSFGKIGHDGHMWLWATIILVFLPKFERCTTNRITRQRVIEVVWSVQFVVLMFYSMSGFLKLLPLPLQIYQSAPTVLSPDALSRHIAARLLMDNSQSILGDFFIRNWWLGWPAFLGGVYLECFSVFVAFRLNLMRLWGLCLIMLHLSIGLTMNIWFSANVLLLGVFFLNSPIGDGTFVSGSNIRSMPVIDLLMNRIHRLFGTNDKTTR